MWANIDENRCAAFQHLKVLTTCSPFTSFISFVISFINTNIIYSLSSSQVKFQELGHLFDNFKPWNCMQAHENACNRMSNLGYYWVTLGNLRNLGEPINFKFMTDRHQSCVIVSKNMRFCVVVYTFPIIDNQNITLLLTTITAATTATIATTTTTSTTTTNTTSTATTSPSSQLIQIISQIVRFKSIQVVNCHATGTGIGDGDWNGKWEWKQRVPPVPGDRDDCIISDSQNQTKYSWRVGGVPNRNV